MKILKSLFEFSKVTIIEVADLIAAACLGVAIGFRELILLPFRCITMVIQALLKPFSFSKTFHGDDSRVLFIKFLLIFLSVIIVTSGFTFSFYYFTQEKYFTQKWIEREKTNRALQILLMQNQQYEYNIPIPEEPEEEQNHFEGYTKG